MALTAAEDRLRERGPVRVVTGGSPRSRQPLPFSLRRMALLGLLGIAVSGFLFYMVQFVPVIAPYTPSRSARRHAGALPWVMLIVVLVDAVTVRHHFRRSRGEEPRPMADLSAGKLPPPLHLEHVAERTIGMTAAASSVLLIGAALLAFPLWAIVLLTLAPWFPCLFVESLGKYEHYGLYAVFGVFVLLEVAHLGEHSVQVLQLLSNHGVLARSHGVFGQLDFEIVHFGWDTLVWLGICVLLGRFGRENPWLWVSLAAASLHEVEHLYLFWLRWVDVTFYNNGGYAGIMGRGGVVGSPLGRPYLHFAYNVVVVVPLVIAFWDQSHRVRDRLAETETGWDEPAREAAIVGTGKSPPTAL